eukprot:960-Heterococcus_DN1.PRE.3
MLLQCAAAVYQIIHAANSRSLFFVSKVATASAMRARVMAYVISTTETTGCGCNSVCKLPSSTEHTRRRSSSRRVVLLGNRAFRVHKYRHATDATVRSVKGAITV